MRERLLALDLSSVAIGWAAFVGRELAAAGTWRIDRAGQRGHRWARFRRNLTTAVATAGPRAVAYELVAGWPAKSGSAAPVAYGGAKAVMELVVVGEYDLPLIPIHTADVKIAAVGKGGGKGTDKAAILEAARRRWPGLEIPDHDAADAAFVGVAALEGRGR